MKKRKREKKTKRKKEHKMEGDRSVASILAPLSGRRF
jgi:hypothetical protein